MVGREVKPFAGRRGGVGGGQVRCWSRGLSSERFFAIPGGVMQDVQLELDRLEQRVTELQRSLPQEQMPQGWRQVLRSMLDEFKQVVEAEKRDPNPAEAELLREGLEVLSSAVQRTGESLARIVKRGRPVHLEAVQSRLASREPGS